MKREELEKIFHVIDFYYSNINVTQKEMLTQRIKENYVEIEEEKKGDRHIKMARALKMDVNAFRNEGAVSIYLNQIDHYEKHIEMLEKEKHIWKLAYDAINIINENTKSLYPMKHDIYWKGRVMASFRDIRDRDTCFVALSNLYPKSKFEKNDGGIYRRKEI